MNEKNAPPSQFEFARPIEKVRSSRGNLIAICGWCRAFVRSCECRVAWQAGRESVGPSLNITAVVRNVEKRLGELIYRPEDALSGYIERKAVEIFKEELEKEAGEGGVSTFPASNGGAKMDTPLDQLPSIALRKGLLKIEQAMNQYGQLTDHWEGMNKARGLIAILTEKQIAAERRQCQEDQTAMDDENYSEVDQVASVLYEAYCEAVGGKAFNGDPLPDWRTFRADTSKQTQSDAWCVVAITAIRELDS